MDTRLNSAVDPILGRVLDVLRKLENGQLRMTPDQIHQVFIDEFGRGRAIMGSDPGWLLASYALAVWIDEMLVDYPWEGARWWRNNVLEMEFFNTRICSTQFFALAEKAASLPDHSTLEVFYLCVILGFRGIYAQPEQVGALAAKLSIPQSLGDWIAKTENMIAVRRSMPTDVPATIRSIAGAPPYRGKTELAWLCVAAAILLTINLIAYQL